MEYAARFIVSLLILAASVWAQEGVKYVKGRGLKIIPLNMTIGGYVSLYYQKDKNLEKFGAEDAALLVFGKIKDRIGYFFEIELDDFYQVVNGKERVKRKIDIERLYLDFEINEYVNLRLGKFITPVGLWNPIYINILKWTTSDPLTAEYFFPQFTTGVQLYGNLPGDWRYFLFFQRNKGIDENYNNFVSKWIIGTEVEKDINENLSLGFNLGKFKLKNKPETLTFWGLNAKYQTHLLEVSGEFMYAWEKEDYLGGSLSYRLSYYLQGVYRVMPKNYAVLRYGFFRDKSDHSRYRILTLGWNFRPSYNFVIKAEYQLRERSEFNKFLASVSWLF